MALPSKKTQLRLKLLLLWLAVAFGHLSHTTSHYLHSEDTHVAEVAHEDSEHGHDSDHSHGSESETCVTCIAFAFIALNFNRSQVKQTDLTPAVILSAKPRRIDHLGLDISDRPAQARAPPSAA